MFRSGRAENDLRRGGKLNFPGMYPEVTAGIDQVDNAADPQPAQQRGAF